MEPMAKALIANPISIQEYKNRRQQAFKHLANLFKKDYSDKKAPGSVSYFLQHKLVSAAFISTGYLSILETQATAGPSWEGFDSSQNLRKTMSRLSSTHISRNAPIISEAKLVKLTQNLIDQFKIPAIFMGTFDLDHEGHKKTISAAKEALGDDGTVLVLVTDDKTSQLTKGKSPIRKLSRRSVNVSEIKGTDYVCPISLPPLVETINQCISFYGDLHTRIQPLIRIIGNPIREDETWWKTYVEQCKQNDILMLFNDDTTGTSSSNDLEVLIERQMV